MARKKRRIGYNNKSSRLGDKKYIIFVSAVLVLMVALVIVLFVFKSRISQISNPIDVSDLINNDQNAYPDKRRNNREEKSDNIEYKEEDKNYLDKLIDQNQ